MDQRDTMKEERIQEQTKSFISERSLILEFFYKIYFKAKGKKSNT